MHAVDGLFAHSAFSGPCLALAGHCVAGQLQACDSARDMSEFLPPRAPPLLQACMRAIQFC